MAEVVKCCLEALVKAAEVVRSGGIVVYPTDTVYGLGCNPYDEKAVERIFKVKGRTRKPLPILVSNPHEAFRIAKFSPQALKVAGFFWPGALTLVLERKPPAPTHLGSRRMVGVRWPKHRDACMLIMLCGGLLVGTSANPTGEKPAQTAGEAKAVLGGKVDLILDGGPAPLGEASTVLDFSGQKPKILRAGALPVKEIIEF
jgi:L-threonylcarbamoyladenylate synthase